ncbi:CPBP family intramembrane glutamic endopeptidase [Mucilaginibacter gilvus]|uniref:CPBP family intramembrane metalloprotease n=1 Tax=Mucilaginibacter gilvus TaxID=2305909 RepID=A0A444MP69_9SPHI|nr:CPBP family intramembrane glutamic endopeptidase [Mucilaginibacter gilvus]RWY52411.1 CPBP family intramembrane metalloprotease [Mucilaginibacter gilvus]
MVKQPVNQLSPGRQLLYFLLLFAGIFIVCNVVGAFGIAGMYGANLLRDIGALNFRNPNVGQALYLLQIIAMTFPIFISSVIFARFVVKEPKDLMGVAKPFPWQTLIVVFFIMMLCLPLIELLSRVNQHLNLPASLKGLEKMIRESEDRAQKLTEAILKMNTIGDMLKNLLLVGLLTAIAEEFMFRGVLQPILYRWTKNQHVAVWVTAAIFSAFHLEFFGFLPRVLLGGLMGYFAIWSGSIWPAVWAHFVNNGSAVIVTYLYQQKKIKINPDDTHTFTYSGYIFSAIIVIILLLVYKNITSGKKQAVNINGEELG